MHTHTDTPRRRGWAAWLALWLPGLLVAVGAAVATAHGLYETARAAESPPLIAALYPLITDGLALVAYAATARLAGSARRYAWLVVVLAAGLSGLAQASYLAHGVAKAPAALRFGVGAWPAIAAAIVAHLLFLIATAQRRTSSQPHAPAVEAQAIETTDPDEPPPVTEPDLAVETPDASEPSAEVERSSVQRPAVQPSAYVQPIVQQAPVHAPPSDPATHPALAPVQPPRSSTVQGPSSRGVGSPARDRAEAAAKHVCAESGELPTVTHLMALAQVSRGTAGEALKALRNQPAPLHLVHETSQQEAHS